MEVHRGSLPSSTEAEVRSGDRQGAESPVMNLLLERMPAMVALTSGPCHAVQIASRAFRHAVRLPKDKILGRRLVDVLHCLEPERFGSLLDSVYETGRTFVRTEMALSLASGPGGKTDFVVNFVCQPLRSGDGQVKGLCFEAVDITSAVEARDQMKRLQEEKDNFVVALAHDLANPATVVLGNSELLLRLMDAGDLDPLVFRESLRAISASARRMTLDCAGLMDLIGMEAGRRPQLLREPVDLVQLVGKVLRDFKASGYSHPTRLESSEEYLIGDWDAGRIESVIVNLVGNALKYSQPDSEVRVVVTREGGLARIDVVDSGIGLEPDELEKIFDRYWRGSKAGVGTGAGVGLASAKYNVELHGGDIRVTSAPGVGSTFSVCLPLSEDSTGIATRPKPESDSYSTRASSGPSVSGFQAAKL
jgi:signal transduction histidine kinase